MIENWKVPHVVKVVVASEATKRYLHEVYGDRLEVEAGANNNNDDGQHAFGFFDKGFNAVVHERPSLIAKELMAGRNVLYLDVDLVLRTDPFAHLTDGYQMWTAMDHEGVSRGRAKSTHHCTAVLAMLATPRVIQFVLDWEEHMTHGNYTFSDQTAFNEVIQSSENTDINVLELSELLFPPGSVYFSPEFELNRAQVVVVHMGVGSVRRCWYSAHVCDRALLPRAPRRLPQLAHQASAAQGPLQAAVRLPSHAGLWPHPRLHPLRPPRDLP